jgi:hypothetical protein
VSAVMTSVWIISLTLLVGSSQDGANFARFSRPSQAIAALS